ncbi:hypothetical protein ASE73_04615 [Sphingomonas sp. Leaf24]|uniref:DUF3667 domain-containing protein n=1 Tax=unclassified Sphingomonas TaxID=196159 RepID=UPI0006FF485A|nr:MULTISPECIES: DUF3667 domain-containing protein [unclassified Sphingomonas]KQM20035.1 hypothetical protein ASE50_04250 [Sphingomonas sp. Leaf5]KQM90813.1 hypothetical protein ASE73_04615 [Sphingomonas sp. Leaf24]
MQGLDDAGALATGGLIAREIEGGSHAPADDRHHLHAGRCLNCGSARIGAFCKECGQSSHLHSDLIGFAHDVLHGVFHFDGKFWSTLPLLAFRPGQLTRRYIDGERTKFVTPMAMFLFSVFLMFAIVSNVPGWTDGGMVPAVGEATPSLGSVHRGIGQAVRDKTETIAMLERDRTAAVAAGRPVASIDTQLTRFRKDLAKLTTAARMLPDLNTASPRLIARSLGEPVDQDLLDWLFVKVEHARENPKLLIYKMKSAGYKYSWALIPLTLPFLWLMFAWRRRFGLYDHTVFATYSIAFMSLLVVVLTLLGYAFGGAGRTFAWIALLAVPPVHIYKQLRYGYELRRLSAVWRTVALLHVVSITSTLFFLLLLYLGVAD